MRIGVPKEIKNHEYRVGLAPSSVRELISHGHEVVIQAGAGGGIGANDDWYRRLGAQIVDDPAEVFAVAEMIVKVKEPQPKERAMLRDGQILFTYLHLAPDSEQTVDLVKSGAICIAYETVTSPHGSLPLLAPMSKVAGRMAIQAGAYCMEHPHGCLGKQLGGVPGGFQHLEGSRRDVGVASLRIIFGRAVEEEDVGQPGEALEGIQGRESFRQLLDKRGGGCSGHCSGRSVLRSRWLSSSRVRKPQRRASSWT
mgnify:CR=1 FL=1